MRNCRIRRVAAIFPAALVWLLPAFAAAQAVTAPLTAVEVFDPMNLFGSGLAFSELRLGRQEGQPRAPAFPKRVPYTEVCLD